MPKGDSRPLWKVLRVLGNLCGLPGFEYSASEEVCFELKKMMQRLPEVYQWQASKASGATEAFAVLPMYQVDPIVRHANALQQSVNQKGIS